MGDMKDSGVEWIGKIPQEWKISKIKYHTHCLDGKRIPIDAALREPGPYPYWGAGNIMDYVNDYIFDEEIVLLGEDGAPFFDENRPVAFLSNEKVWVNNHIHVLKGKTTMLNSFLVYFLNSVKYDVYINGSIINKLTQANMNNINIVVPIVAEQQLIADFLDDKVGKINQILENLNKQIEILQKYKQSIITRTVTKGLNLNISMKDSGIEWIGTIPEHWEIKRIKNYNKLQTGTTPAENIGINYEKNEHNYYWFTPGDFNREDYNLYISERTIEDTVIKENHIKLYPAHSILFVAIGATIGKIGCNNEDSYANQQITALIPNGINYRYELYYLVSKSEYMKENALYTTLPIMNNQYLGNIKITIPPLEEQKDIADYLDKKCSQIDKLIYDKQMQVEKMEKYKKSLIYEYITGKKRVKGAEKLYG